MQNNIKVHELSLGLSQAYLIQVKNEWILVDAGVPGQEGLILRMLKSLGCCDLRLIYLTHAHIDHVGSAAALREVTGAPIGLHHLDAEALARGETRLGSIRGSRRQTRKVLAGVEQLLKVKGVQADFLFEDGDHLAEFGMDAMVYHTPGHTLGSSSLVVENRVAFVGDLASTTGKPHLQRYYAQDWDKLDDSYNRVHVLGLERIYGGHGRGYFTGEQFGQIGLS